MSSNGSKRQPLDREARERERFARLRTVWLIEDAAQPSRLATAPRDTALAVAMRTAAQSARPTVMPRV